MPIHKLGFCRVFILALQLVLGACTPLFAQSNTTSLNGTVVDPQGGLIPGVAISLTNQATGTKQSTVSRSKGEYVFSQLTPAEYEVHVNGQNFSEQVQTVKLLVGTICTDAGIRKQRRVEVPAVIQEAIVHGHLEGVVPLGPGHVVREVMRRDEVNA